MNTHWEATGHETENLIYGSCQRKTRPPMRGEIMEWNKEKTNLSLFFFIAVACGVWWAVACISASAVLEFTVQLMAARGSSRVSGYSAQLRNLCAILWSNTGRWYTLKSTLHQWGVMLWRKYIRITRATMKKVSLTYTKTCLNIRSTVQGSKYSVK